MVCWTGEKRRVVKLVLLDTILFSGADSGALQCNGRGAADIEAMDNGQMVGC